LHCWSYNKEVNQLGRGLACLERGAKMSTVYQLQSNFCAKVAEVLKEAWYFGGVFPETGKLAGCRPNKEAGSNRFIGMKTLEICWE
jgi:hypothetical protein